MNEYTGIVDYYDNFMTSGYYDYEHLSVALDALLRQISARKILECGIGTGLIAEKLLDINGTYELTGIDFTLEMLDLARKRLNGKANLIIGDVRSIELPDTYDAVFSNGGVWYFIDEGDRVYALCSHIPDIENCYKSMKNIARNIKKGGMLILSIQGTHKDYEEKLSDGLTYLQIIFPNGDCFDKIYLFKKNSEFLAKQICTYKLFDFQTAKLMLYDAGFEFKGVDKTNQFIFFAKRSHG
jgi:ubiquinone/menaquinone biosynthesis C-methylase UbiE